MPHKNEKDAAFRVDFHWYGKSALKHILDETDSLETYRFTASVRSGNDKYSIVSNYKTDELVELGFSKDEINKLKRIAIYDELLLNPDFNSIE